MVAILAASGYDGFDIGLSTEGVFNLPAQTLSSLLSLSFSGLKFLAEVSGSAVRWAVTLDSTSWFGGTVNNMTRSVHSAVGFQSTSFGDTLYRLILVAAVALIFWRLTRGDTTRAVTNLLVTVLVLTVYLAWYQQSNGESLGIASGAVTTAQQLGAGLAADLIGAHPATLPGNCRAEYDALADPAAVGLSDEERADRSQQRSAVSVGCVIEASVRTSLVLPVYDLANWGRLLGRADDGGNPMRACAAVRDRLVATGPHGNSDHPRDEMRDEASCEELADYQASTDWNKFWVTSMFGLFSIFMLVPALIIAVAAVWLGFRLVLIAMFVPVVAAVGLIPGEPRAVLWRWGASALQRMITLASGYVMMAVWAVFITNISASAVTSGAARWGGGILTGLIPLVYGIMLGLVLLVGWWKLTRRGKAVTNRLADRMASIEGISAAGGSQDRAGTAARRAHRRVRHAEQVVQGYRDGGVRGASGAFMHRRRGAMARSARSITPPTP